MLHLRCCTLVTAPGLSHLLLYISLNTLNATWLLHPLLHMMLHQLLSQLLHQLLLKLLTNSFVSAACSALLLLLLLKIAEASVVGAAVCRAYSSCCMCCCTCCQVNSCSHNSVDNCSGSVMHANHINPSGFLSQLCYQAHAVHLKCTLCHEM